MVARKAATALRLMGPLTAPTQRSREARQRLSGGRNRFAVVRGRQNAFARFPVNGRKNDPRNHTKLNEQRAKLVNQLR